LKKDEQLQMEASREKANAQADEIEKSKRQAKEKRGGGQRRRGEQKHNRG